MAAVVTTRRRVRIPTAGTVRRIVQDELRSEAETKMLDTVGSSALTTSPVEQHLSAIAQGSDYYQRLGIDVRCRRLYVRFALFYNTASTPTTQSARILLVMDTQSNNATMTPAGSAPNGLFLAAAPGLQQQRNLLTTNRYLVLADETHWVSAAFRAVYYGEIGVNLRNHINFSGTGSGVGNILNNALYIVVWTDFGTNPATFSYSARLWYQDA